MSLSRFVWRFRRLTFVELLRSYFLKTCRLKHLDFEGYRTRYAELPPVEIVSRTTKPFIVIRPEGMPLEAAIRETLKQQGVKIGQEFAINDFPGLQLALHALHEKREHQRQEGNAADHGSPSGPEWIALCLRLEADKIRCPETYRRAKLLILEGVNVNDLRLLKWVIRSHLGPIRFFRVTYENSSETVFSGYIHVPDAEDLPGEYAAVNRFIV